MQRIERNLDDNRMSLPEEGFAEYASLAHSITSCCAESGTHAGEVDRQEQFCGAWRSARFRSRSIPIFYNTLDSIVRVMEGPHAGGHRDGAGVGLFGPLSTTAIILTVEQEMDYANYLTIQQVRYKKRFKYELYMDEHRTCPAPRSSCSR